MAEQRVWLITGCSGGLGQGIALAALERGDKVLATARKPETLRPLLEAFPERAAAQKLDMTDPADISAAVDSAQRRFRRIDVLVNNAGHGFRAAVEEATEAEIHELFQTNFFGPVRLIQAVLLLMRGQGSGTIVNISSIGAVSSGRGSSYYSASKAALEQLSEGLAAEVEAFGLRVIIIEPGAMRTNFFESSMRGSKNAMDAYAAALQGRRKGDPVDYSRIRGNPLRGGEAIWEAVNMDEPPRRLLLGSDAVDIVRKVLTKRIAELENFKKLSFWLDGEERAPR